MESIIDSLQGRLTTLDLVSGIVRSLTSYNWYHPVIYQLELVLSQWSSLVELALAKMEGRDI